MTQSKNLRRYKPEPTFHWFWPKPIYLQSELSEVNRIPSIMKQSQKKVRLIPSKLRKRRTIQFQDDNNHWHDWFYIAKSRIHNAGEGVFANRQFKEAEIITRYLGNFTHDAKTVYKWKSDKHRNQYIMTLIREHNQNTSYTYVSPNKDATFLYAHKFNHLDDVELTNVHVNMKTGCYEAKFPINKGDELFIFYGEYFSAGKFHEHKRES